MRICETIVLEFLIFPNQKFWNDQCSSSIGESELSPFPKKIQNDIMMIYEEVTHATKKYTNKGGPCQDAA